MIRLLVIIALIGTIGGLAVYYMDGFRQTVVEAVSPASKEARLLNELSANLEVLGKIERSPGPEQLEYQSILQHSEKLLEEIKEVNDQRSPITDGGAHIIEVVKNVVQKSSTPGPSPSGIPEETIEYKTSSGEKLICRPAN